MKKVFCMCAMLLCVKSLMADVLEEEEIITLTKVTPEVVSEFCTGDFKKFILECPEGLVLPFTVDLKGEFLAVENYSPFNVRVLKTCYMKCPEKGVILFSSDLITWKTFLEFFTGKVTAYITVEHELPEAGVDLEIHQRM